MSSTGKDFSHCLHGSPIVEKPRFSKDSKSTFSSCKSDANKKGTPIDTSLTKADGGGPGG